MMKPCQDMVLDDLIIMEKQNLIRRNYCHPEFYTHMHTHTHCTPMGTLNQAYFLNYMMSKKNMFLQSEHTSKNKFGRNMESLYGGNINSPSSSTDPFAYYGF